MFSVSMEVGIDASSVLLK